MQGGLQPDLTLYFDLDVAIARQRLAGTGNAPDRFELEQQAFFERVREAYRRRVAEDSARYCLIDARQTVDEIRALLETELARVA